jgi:hypothetical protein
MRRRLPRFTDRLRLGDSGLRVSPVCLGMVGSDRTIAAAFEAGINCFFLTADMHWPLYEWSRRGLQKLIRSRKGVRDEIVVAVASYPTQPEFCTMPFEEVVAAIPGLGRVDVAVMGGVYAADLVARHAVYAGHKRSHYLGVRAIGGTFHDRKAVPAAMAHGLVDMAFARYNPSHPGARHDLFPAVSPSTRVPLFNFKSTGGYVTSRRRIELGVTAEHWQPRLTDYYRFALTRAEVQGLLCAPQTPREVAALGEALEAGPLSDAEENFLINLASLDAGDTTLASDATRVV